MPKCSYCKKTYEPPRGLTLILKDNSVKHLCSSKCRKNMLMKRRKVRWVDKDKKNKSVKQVEEVDPVKEEEPIKEEKKIEKVEEKKEI